ncbi:hypothetical protein JVT61DRAFT_11491 [Boletus reticuloceps]|uniref:Translation initiation factor IF-2, mitochondrial n=1 Tax=Boletus reticuloceps TaxID=495285 RepID=A0A8I3AE36_9AGAM|nr:hypothetical protein JVT61DRAFT_11491 [Boletus reticuloceps]
MHRWPTVLHFPRNARPAATAPRIQPVQSRQALQSEHDRVPEAGAFRHAPPRLVSRQSQVKPSERGSFRSNAHTPRPQPRPHLTLRPSPPQSNECGSFRPLVLQSETKPSPPSRLSRLKFKERESLRSGHDFFTGANKGSAGERARWNGKKREGDGSNKFQPNKQVQADLYIPSTVSVGQLAKLLNVRLRTLQRKMDQVGMHAESSYDYVLTSDYAALLVQEFDRNPIINDEAAFDLYPPPPPENPHLLPTRPPIVAIMGHVDHGKTTLLDNLRSSSVASSEAGGITQHIGAFCVPLSMSSDSPSMPANERLITFLDTPGHAAFSAMRARGASVTDIVVLVVAADDGVMPQTIEIMNLVKREQEASNIGMVVAINKVDKPEADVDKTKLALLSAGVPLEEGGGDVPCVTVSGLTGSGLPELVETIALVADVMDLRAERDCTPVGYVLESRMLKGFGPVATVLMTRGTLSPGIPLLAGTSSCSTRRLLSPSLQPINLAAPGTPVLVTGWKTLPATGEEVLTGSETDIKKACANRERKRDLESALGDVEAINATRQAEKEREIANKAKRGTRGPRTVAEDSSVQVKKKYLRIVVKGDVSGSVEALVGAVKDIGNHLAGVKIVSIGVGDVSDSDVMMAKAADATIVAFSVGMPRTVRASASQNHVPIYTSDIIYRIIDDIRDRVISLLPCAYDIKVTGEATVLQLFDIQTKGTCKRIAGCRVTQGIVQRSSSVRVLREGKTVYEGSIDALKQLKKDVAEVRKGSECGVSLQDVDNLQDGDVIQMFQKIEIPAQL